VSVLQGVIHKSKNTMRDDLYVDFYSLETSHWWFCARRLIVEMLLNEHIGGRRAPLIADVGCGTGANLAMLHRVGRPVGIDASWRALTFAQSRGETALVAGTLPSLPCQNESFDVVCALDVIEHIENDAAAVEELVRVCKPGGLIVITVPAYQWLWSEHDVVNEHKRRYTRTNLGTRVKHPQVEALKLTYMNTFLALPMMAYRLMRNLSRTRHPEARATSDLVAPPAMVNRILFWIFCMEKFWLRCGSFPFGISVVCILRKHEL
jgi:SAM-dependent methyltransferase